jgi:hypothetical protein
MQLKRSRNEASSTIDTTLQRASLRHVKLRSFDCERDGAATVRRAG